MGCSSSKSVEVENDKMMSAFKKAQVMDNDTIIKISN
jgi:hypothetical protein